MRSKDFVLSPLSIEELEEMIKRCVVEGITTITTNTQKEDDDELLTVHQAAKFLKVSLVSIHNWKREKNLKFHRLGRSIRFKKKDLIEFMERK